MSSVNINHLKNNVENGSGRIADKMGHQNEYGGMVIIGYGLSLIAVAIIAVAVAVNDQTFN